MERKEKLGVGGTDVPASPCDGSFVLFDRMLAVGLVGHKTGDVILLICLRVSGVGFVLLGETGVRVTLLGDGDRTLPVGVVVVVVVVVARLMDNGRPGFPSTP
jgi:hypothetical protein